jgi:hypothetical protein
MLTPAIRLVDSPSICMMLFWKSAERKYMKNDKDRVNF